MELIGSSSIWEHKYRPRTVKDLILPDNIRKLFNSYITSKDIPQLLFSSTAGRGKTSSAYALVHDLHSDMMYINGSIDNSIDTLRYKVTQYAMTSSFNDGKKICIIDECERLSPSAQDGMKGLMDQTESNCRFILTTNNVSKIIDPIISRGTHINFNFPQSETKNLMIAYFKRMCYVLDTENVKYDKQVIAEFVQQMYPDFRKTIGDLQKYYKMFGEINEGIFKSVDGSMFASLMTEIKNKKFNAMRKIVSEIDHDMVYDTFDKQMEIFVEPTSLPDAATILGRFVFETAFSSNKNASLTAFCTELMKDVKFK